MKRSALLTGILITLLPTTAVYASNRAGVVPTAPTTVVEERTDSQPSSRPATTQTASYAEREQAAPELADFQGGGGGLYIGGSTVAIVLLIVLLVILL